MEKKIVIFFYIIFCTFSSSPQTISSPTFISISNNKFYHGNVEFKPLCINYIINFTKDNNQNNYYISPHYNYSHIWGTSTTDFTGRYIFSNTNERQAALNKLDNDLHIMDSLGFNVVRLSPTISWEDTNHIIPTPSYQEYFDLYDSLLSKINRHNLHAILVLGADPNCYLHFQKYTEYLAQISNHFRNNTTIMAYVVLAEPFFSWAAESEQDKLKISHWSQIWYYTIKKNAPKQLITYGIEEPKTLINWDPSSLSYDFLSLHLYHRTNNPTIAKNSISSYFKWMNDNYDKTWIIAETGFSGTNDSIQHRDTTTGSENDQYIFADHIMQKSLDCGCKGFAWWQFQDVRWCDKSPYWEEHLGILTYFPEQRKKQINSLFPNFAARSIQTSNCTRPTNYYNLESLPSLKVSGYVEDENHNPIKDAIIVGWSPHYKKLYSTFSNNSGYYHLYTEPDSSIVLLWISHLGYSSKKYSYNNIHYTQGTTTLTHINYNHWVKSWTSNSDYPVQSDFIQIGSTDTFLVGNFYGDEADELLSINFSTQTAKMYQFNINHWEEIWNGTIGGWVIRQLDKFYPIDLNGDGIDDLLCIHNIDNGWADIYGFNISNSYSAWYYKWTNSGNGYIGNWRIKKDDIFLIGKFSNNYKDDLLCIDNKNRKKALLQNYSSSWSSLWSSSSWIGEWNIRNMDIFYHGDFDGDSKEDLFCVQSTSGNSDWMTLLRFSNNTWQRIWSNDGSSDFSIYPYRKRLCVGNFDNDPSDEILGIFTWATKFDFNPISSNWNWSWSSSNSLHISDWSINLNDNIFFFKTNAITPDYLFTIKYTPYIFNGYFFKQ